MNELLTFTAFLGLSLLAHYGHVNGWLTRHATHVKWLVWLVHPALWHAAQEYTAHFVVYSGYVLGH